MTELTLDCDTLVKELEQDSENRGTIYLAGVGEAFRERLLREVILFPGLEAVMLPKDLGHREQRKHCFLSERRLLSEALGGGQRVMTGGLAAPTSVPVPRPWLGSSGTSRIGP